MRRFFRFSIRDLLWLTLVVAAGLASGLSSYRYGKDAGRIEVRATLEDGRVVKWNGREFYVFENGEWHHAPTALSVLHRGQELEPAPD